MRLALTVGEVLLPLLYLLLFVAYLWVFYENRRFAHLWARRLLATTVVAHLAASVIHARVHHHLPMASPLEFLSLLALSLLLIYAVVERRLRVRETGFLVTGVAFLLQFIASAFSVAEPAANPLLEDPGYAGHAVLVLLAYTALSLSFLYAVLYLVLARQLARKTFGLLFRRLPPLEVLERMSVGAAKLGVPLLFGALALGHLWLYDLADKLDPETARSLTPFDPKILTSWLIFLVYLVGLAGHRWWGWRGRRMNTLAILTYLAVVLAMGAIHHFIPSFHNFSLRGGV
ncbi:MAG: cytochrome c biogenesis protein CcsA [bacterium]|nr:cytochrome c biogenesis protein CcsA [bacterium]